MLSMQYVYVTQLNTACDSMCLVPKLQVTKTDIRLFCFNHNIDVLVNLHLENLDEVINFWEA